MDVSRKKGFGLIEILVVVSIVGILSSVGAVATKEFRTKAKVAKVQQETHTVESAFDVYQATSGGYPNPSPGERKAYCVGSNDCAFRGKAVTDQLSVDGMPVFEELIGFENDFGLTQGYMYVSCGDLTVTCEADDTALLYGLPEEEWLDIFGSDYEFEYDDFDWGDWEWEEIDWGDYESYGGGGTGQLAQCSPEDYTLRLINDQISAPQPVIMMSSTDCTWNATMGYSECDISCDAAASNFSDDVRGVYPFPYCGQSIGTQFNPNCVQFEGGTLCKDDC